MTEAEKKALELYPIKDVGADYPVDANEVLRKAFLKGVELFGMNWTEYSWENKDSHPPYLGRYLIYRRGCDEMHFERWNGNGWASSNIDCTHWTNPKRP